jgi:hypothetical protein
MPPLAFPRSSTNPPSWLEVQENADAILAGGLRHLLAQARLPWGSVGTSQAGVYVFSDAETTAYVGESTSVSWRIDQHFKSNSRLMQSLRTAGIADPVAHAASTFDVRAVPVDIGRLELEEMAIACLHPTFNAMHMVSRMARRYHDADIELWLRVEEDCEPLLRKGADVATNVDPVAWSQMRPPSGAGLYILRDERGKDAVCRRDRRTR